MHSLVIMELQRVLSILAVLVNKMKFSSWHVDDGPIIGDFLCDQSHYRYNRFGLGMIGM
jgi:hypothetical protein